MCVFMPYRSNTALCNGECVHAVLVSYDCVSVYSSHLALIELCVCVFMPFSFHRTMCECVHAI